MCPHTTIYVYVTHIYSLIRTHSIQSVADIIITERRGELVIDEIGTAPEVRNLDHFPSVQIGTEELNRPDLHWYMPT
jgi:hypothetical protein